MCEEIENSPLFKALLGNKNGSYQEYKKVEMRWEIVFYLDPLISSHNHGQKGFA